MNKKTGSLIIVILLVIFALFGNQETTSLYPIEHLEALPANVQNAYILYTEDGWNGAVDGQTDGTKAGGKWGNYDDQLPMTDENGDTITYKEFDVNNKIEDMTRDAERFVVGSDGRVYYTEDHYDTFIEISE